MEVVRRVNGCGGGVGGVRSGSGVAGGAGGEWIWRCIWCVEVVDMMVHGAWSYTWRRWWCM